jgi:hypothetical protein
MAHLLYVDDIKLYASTQRQLKQSLEITEQFSAGIQMSLRTDKCKTQTITAGVVEIVGFELRQGGAIEPMDENESYKYLGMQQTRGIEHKHIKEKLKKKFFKRVEAVLKTKLSGKHNQGDKYICDLSSHIFLLTDIK